jgi:aminoglycoside phosphotransferase (APT) family kinase protein
MSAPTPLPPALADVLDDAIGAHRVVEREVSGNGGARAWWVRSGAGRFVVKVVGEHDSHRLDLTRTARAQHLAHQAGVPVPTVVRAVRGPGWTCLVTEHVDGIPWREARASLDDADVAAVHAALEDVVRRLRRVPFAGFGSLDDPRLDELDALREHARLRIADPAHARLAARVLDRESALFDRRDAVLVHDDLHHGNVLVRRSGDGWALAAVVDWDKAWSGPADADAARMAFWDDMPGEEDADDRRALVHQLLWCLEYPAATDRHRDDLRRLTRLLGAGPTQH